jgi:hypothetical protein
VPHHCCKAHYPKRLLTKELACVEMMNMPFPDEL